ncbi:M10 family metallopeptidase C-terminal domain-containing protein [Pseudomonas paralactis]|uniref:M10 family metallopeptidase C-terminal domain-containing protein n=1 Tax=Pseudomonas paralactis TaxID=1615673 RepID=UPI001EE1BF25|nr:M10 family metallopeptidase C-terminal domain-containing protein [Pseudomonas paralactis]
MSTINPQHALSTPPSPPQPSIGAHIQGLPTSQQLETLLKAGPNWSAAPKAPDRSEQSPDTRANQISPEQHTDATKRVSDARTLLTPETINALQSNPDSAQSQVIKSELEWIFQPENRRAALRGPDAKANRQKLEEMNVLLDEGAKNLNSARHKTTEQVMNRFTFKNIEALLGAFDSDASISVGRLDHSLAELTKIEQNYSRMDSTYKTLSNTCNSLAKDKLDASQADTVSMPSASDTHNDSCATYSFSSASESTLESPQEVRNFKSQDKLNLAGIQKQLNTSLRTVERTPESSGEIQIQYLPNNNASVVVIADAPGKPAFVLKVFGEVRQSNIVT